MCVGAKIEEQDESFCEWRSNCLLPRWPTTMNSYKYTSKEHITNLKRLQQCFELHTNVLKACPFSLHGLVYIIPLGVNILHYQGSACDVKCCVHVISPQRNTFCHAHSLFDTFRSPMMTMLSVIQQTFLCEHKMAFMKPCFLWYSILCQCRSQQKCYTTGPSFLQWMRRGSSRSGWHTFTQLPCCIGICWTQPEWLSLDWFYSECKG